MRRRFAWMASASALSLGCTQPSAGSNGLYDAGLNLGRVPSSHRPTGTTCPQGRGPGTLVASCGYDAGPARPCLSDTDCTAGQSGRCLPAPSVVCDTACSYDECFSDSDCKSVPCSCRATASASTANACLAGSGCVVDSDCGPSGYCSPSAAGCGILYFCHTPNDTCTDNADCASNEGCNYDGHAQAWTCSVMCVRPA